MDVTLQRCRPVADEVSEGKARDTIKRYASVLRQLWNWAHIRLDEAPPP